MNTSGTIQGRPHVRHLRSSWVGGPARLLPSAALALHNHADSRLLPEDCPQRGTWPGPNGDHYLNEFADGSCNVLIQPATFPDSAAGTPAVLNMDSGTWTVESDVVFDTGSTVTVDPGVTLDDTLAPNAGAPDAIINVNGTMTFQAGSSYTAACPACGILVSEYSFDAGTLNIDGINGAPVTMSGTGAGSWMGLVLHGNSTDTINYLDLSDAGANTQPCGGCGSYKAGIFISGTSPTISNTNVSNTDGNGIEVQCVGTCSAPDPVFTNITLDNNSRYGMQFDFLTPYLTSISGLSMIGNGHNAICLESGSYGGNVTWPNIGVPYVLDGPNVILDAGASLTVAPGDTLQFIAGNAEALIVSTGATLTMAGTAVQPITLTSAAAAPAPGDWAGILLDGTGSFSHVHISYAGADNGSGGHAGLYVDGFNPPINNVTIDHSSGNGLEVSSGVPLLTSVALNSNAGYPLQYDTLPENLAQCTISFSGNTHNAISITSAGAGYSVAATWPNFGVPYVLSSGLLQIGSGASLTLAPGDIIRATPGSGASFEVHSGGSLIMNGTSSQPITLTSDGAAPAPGDWPGLIFETGSAGSVRHVHISYAGASNDFSDHAAIDISRAPIIVNSTTIDHSSGNDVLTTGGGAVLHNDSFGTVPTGTTSPCPCYGVDNTSSTTVDATYSWWSDVSGPYDPTGNPSGIGTPVSANVTYRPWLGNTTLAPISLTSGWNALGMPNASADSAAALTSDLQSQNAGLRVEALAIFGNGRFTLYVPNFSDDVPLQTQAGVFALTSGAGSWAPGSEPHDAAAMGVQRGWNFLTIGNPATLAASSICSQISGCSEVARYSGGTWQVYTPTGGTSFSVSAGQGFMVLASQASNWTPHS